MKINRHDQAKILTLHEISRLFSEGLTTTRDRSLFGICLYTACRINEACSLHTADVYNAKSDIRERTTIRRKTTKGEQSTRSIPMSAELRAILQAYRSEKAYLFPGRHGRGHLNPRSADAILRSALEHLEIEGAATHSFRQTAITHMHNAKVPIKHIQEISGHKTLSALQRYVEVTEQDKEAAIATLSFRR